MNEFIIVFRESLEACLIIGIIYILLEKNNLKKELKQVWLGVFSAIAASILVAILLNSAVFFLNCDSNDFVAFIPAVELVNILSISR